MNSLITNDGKYIGQYLHIKDSEFSVRMFTKFYNLATQNDVFSIDKNTAKDLIHAGKYRMRPNKIYVNDPDSDKNVLKSLKIGDYMVFIQETNKLYIFNKDEFKKFMNNNNYKKDESITYVLGIDNGVEFKNMRVIVSNNLDNAINIYINRYHTEDKPVCIGIINNNKLNIFSDKYKFSVPLIM